MTYYHHNSRIYLVDREEPNKNSFRYHQDWHEWCQYLKTVTSYECRVPGLKEGVVVEGIDFILVQIPAGQKDGATRWAITPPDRSEVVMEERVWPLLGYAPGNYTNACGCCEKMMTNVDKLCFMCLECAVKEANKMLEAYASLPAQQIAADAGIKFVLEDCGEYKKYSIKIGEWLIMFSHTEKLGVVSLFNNKEVVQQASLPSTTEGYSRGEVLKIMEWLRMKRGNGIGWDGADPTKDWFIEGHKGKRFETDAVLTSYINNLK